MISKGCRGSLKEPMTFGFTLWESKVNVCEVLKVLLDTVAAALFTDDLGCLVSSCMLQAGLLLLRPGVPPLHSFSRISLK